MCSVKSDQPKASLIRAIGARWRWAAEFVVLALAVVALFMCYHHSPPPAPPLADYLILQVPRPVVFCLTSSKEAMTDPYFGTIAKRLAARGWVAVSVDLPCHGADIRPGERPELDGWRDRVAAGEDIVSPFCARASKVLDELIAKGVADPNHVAVYGMSRGGFMAYQLAARDRRFATVAMLGPVTDWSALDEGRGQHLTLDDVPALGPATAVAAWIGSDDPRVSTAACVRFAASHGVKLTVIEGLNKHTCTPEEFSEAADFIEQSR